MWAVPLSVPPKSGVVVFAGGTTEPLSIPIHMSDVPTHMEIHNLIETYDPILALSNGNLVRTHAALAPSRVIRGLGNGRIGCHPYRCIAGTLRRIGDVGWSSKARPESERKGGNYGDFVRDDDD